MERVLFLTWSVCAFKLYDASDWSIQHYLLWTVTIDGALTLLGMGALAGIHFSVSARAAGLELVIGSFAATAVLVYAAPNSPRS